MEKKIRVTQEFKIMEFQYPYAEKINPLLEKEIREAGNAQEYQTKCRCYMTDYLMKTPAFETLKTYIIDCVSTYADNAYMWHGSWELWNMWGLIYKKGDMAEEHNHWPSTYSFVYYVNCPPGSSPLKFRGHTIKPKNGTLTVFPSNLNHYVPKHSINKERIVISGNMSMSIDFIRKNITNSESCR